MSDDGVQRAAMEQLVENLPAIYRASVSILSEFAKLQAPDDDFDRAQLDRMYSHASVEEKVAILNDGIDAFGGTLSGSADDASLAVDDGFIAITTGAPYAQRGDPEPGARGHASVDQSMLHDIGCLVNTARLSVHMLAWLRDIDHSNTDSELTLFHLRDVFPSRFLNPCAVKDAEANTSDPSMRKTLLLSLDIRTHYAMTRIAAVDTENHEDADAKESPQLTFIENGLRDYQNVNGFKGWRDDVFHTNIGATVERMIAMRMRSIKSIWNGVRGDDQNTILVTKLRERYRRSDLTVQIMNWIHIRYEELLSSIQSGSGAEYIATEIQLDYEIEQSDYGLEKLDHGLEQSNYELEQSDYGLEQQDYGLEQQDQERATESAKRHVYSPILSVSDMMDILKGSDRFTHSLRSLQADAAPAFAGSFSSSTASSFASYATGSSASPFANLFASSSSKRRVEDEPQSQKRKRGAGLSPHEKMNRDYPDSSDGPGRSSSGGTSDAEKDKTDEKSRRRYFKKLGLWYVNKFQPEVLGKRAQSNSKRRHWKSEEIGALIHYLKESECNSNRKEIRWIDIKKRDNDEYNILDGWVNTSLKDKATAMKTNMLKTGLGEDQLPMGFQKVVAKKQTN